MHRCHHWVFILFIILLVTRVQAASGRDAVCEADSATVLSPLSQIKDVEKLGCHLECESFWRENPDARPKPGESLYCMGRDEYQNRALGLEGNVAILKGCGKGFFLGLGTAPDQIDALLEKLEGFATTKIQKPLQQHFQKQRALLERCQTSAECRRGIGRQLPRYSLKDATGKWTVSDQAMDAEVQKLDAVALIDQLKTVEQSRKRECLDVLSRITRELSLTSSEDNLALPRERYHRISRERPECALMLDLREPTVVAFSSERSAKPSLLERVGANQKCYDVTKVNELLCFEAAYQLADPLGLALGSVGAAVRFAKVAGLKAAPVPARNAAAAAPASDAKPTILVPKPGLPTPKPYTSAPKSETHVSKSGAPAPNSSLSAPQSQKHASQAASLSIEDEIRSKVHTNLGFQPEFPRVEEQWQNRPFIHLRATKSSGVGIGQFSYSLEDGGKTLQVDPISIETKFRNKSVSELMLVEALKQQPQVERIGVSSLIGVNEKFVRDALAAGLSCIDAIKETPAYKMRARLGFSKIIGEPDCKEGSFLVSR